MSRDEMYDHLDRSKDDYAEVAEKVMELTEVTWQLRAMVSELVDVYWGEGDSDPSNPPEIIKRAKCLLKST